MTTWCRQVRAALNAGDATRDDPAVAEHLIECADCARFAHRLAAFRDAWPGAGGSATTFAERLRGRHGRSAANRIGRALARSALWTAVVAAIVAAALLANRDVIARHWPLLGPPVVADRVAP